MTRKLPSILVVVLVLTLAAMAQAPADTPAAPTPGAGATKIGIIDIQRAIQTTNEGQRDIQALQKKFEPKMIELQNANAEIESMKKQLQTQGDKLNETARNNLVRDIESKQKVLQRNSEDAQADYSNQGNDIVERIGGKMIEVLRKYSSANGYAVVLNVGNQSSPVLWNNPSTDITQPIVDAYNAQSNVSAPAAGAAPASPKPVAPKATTTAPAPAPKK
jgi:outer membrane protein